MTNLPEVSAVNVVPTGHTPAEGEFAGVLTGMDGDPKSKNNNVKELTACKDLTSSITPKTETDGPEIKSETEDDINYVPLCKLEKNSVKVEDDHELKSEEAIATIKSEILSNILMVKTEDNAQLEMDNDSEQNLSFIRPESSNDENTDPDHKALESEQLTEFSVIDASLITSLTKKQVKRTKRKRKKKTVPKLSTTKCTPLDRTINATTKAIFDQLKAIKQEVKKEANVVEETLNDLEIPELNVSQLTSSISAPSVVTKENDHSEVEQQENIHSEVEQQQRNDSDVNTRNASPPPIVKSDDTDDQINPNKDEGNPTIEDDNELKTSLLQSKGRKRPQIN